MTQAFLFYPITGLEELVLSSNPEITAKGWAKLGVAMAAGCNLSSLYVDYNELGDSSASCLLVAMAGTKSLETLDMECVGATETTGQVWFDRQTSQDSGILQIPETY